MTRIKSASLRLERETKPRALSAPTKRISHKFIKTSAPLAFNFYSKS